LVAGSFAVSRGAGLLVDVFAVTNSDDQHKDYGIEDFVDHAKVTDSHAVEPIFAF